METIPHPEEPTLRSGPSPSEWVSPGPGTSESSRSEIPVPVSIQQTIQPPWWNQVWTYGRNWFTNRSGSPLNQHHPAPLRAQAELQHDLTLVLLTLVARYSGIEAKELLRSEGLNDWVGQHLQGVTNTAPEWLQFVTLVGAKKLRRHLVPEDFLLQPPTTPVVEFPVMLDPNAILPMPVPIVEEETKQEETIPTSGTEEEDTVMMTEATIHSIKEDGEEDPSSTPSKAATKRKRPPTPSAAKKPKKLAVTDEEPITIPVIPKREKPTPIKIPKIPPKKTTKKKEKKADDNQNESQSTNKMEDADTTVQPLIPLGGGESSSDPLPLL